MAKSFFVKKGRWIHYHTILNNKLGKELENSVFGGHIIIQNWHHNSETIDSLWRCMRDGTIFLFGFER